MVSLKGLAQRRLNIDVFNTVIKDNIWYNEEKGVAERLSPRCRL